MSCPFCNSPWSLDSFVCGTYIPEDKDMGDITNRYKESGIKYSNYVQSDRCKELTTIRLRRLRDA